MSGRLAYRPISLDDFEPYHEFLNDPDCLRYLLHPNPHTEEQSRSLLQRNVEAHDGRIGLYTVLVDGEAVGWSGFQRRQLDWGDEVELGWLFRRPFWGRGYATEAARHLRPLGPDRVVHLIHPENAASAAVARKLGAVKERYVELPVPVDVWASRSSTG